MDLVGREYTVKDQAFMTEVEPICELCGQFHRKDSECPLP